MTRIANGIAAVLVLSVVPFMAGCKTDISQQLLERELRMQEDQIYLLQDELQEKCARLDRVAGENTSLKKQLGIVDPNASLPTRIDLPPGIASPARSLLGAPTIAPPPLKLKLPEPVGVPPVGPVGAGSGSADGPRFGPPAGEPAAPATLLPPPLEGVPPPLPAAPGDRGAAAPAIKRLSHEESLAVEGQITHLVINPGKTECFDGDGDGTTDGLAIVFEPRDGDERLVTAAGDVTISAFDPAGGGGTGEGACIAKWEIASADALAHFRRTSRARGLHFRLPWQGTPPAADHVRLFVRLTTFDGQSFETDATVRTR